MTPGIDFLKRQAADPAPYSLIPPVYDLLMGEVEYREWAGYVEELMARAGILPGASVLDLACGTGTMACLMAERGYRVRGLDLSPAMLQEARRKAIRSGDTVEWQPGDMRDFTLPTAVDAVICLFDSMNHLTDEDQLLRCFSCVRRALRPGGLFLFDLNTIYTLSQVWGNSTKFREDQSLYSIWRNQYEPCSRTCRLSLTVFVSENGLYRKLHEVHRERGYELDAVTELLRQAGFKEVKLYKHSTFESPAADTSRVMVATYT